MSNLARAISADGSAFAIALDSTALVSEIEQTHHTSAVVSAALGRLATAAALMGALLKGEQDSLTLRINGGGLAGTLISVADSRGHVKACVDRPVVELPLRSDGKLDVAGAVGKDGTLSVIRDVGMKEPYSGQVPIVSGEIAEDITHYYAVSEQTPTVCALGVLVNPDLTIRSAGGFLLQLLPYADESCIDRIEQNIAKLPPVSSLFAEGETPQSLALRLLEGLDPNPLDEQMVGYCCNCSRERTKRILGSLGAQELQRMIDEKEPVEVQCHFCNSRYRFSLDEMQQMVERMRAGKGAVH